MLRYKTDIFSFLLPESFFHAETHIFHNATLIMINHPSLEVHLCNADPRNANGLLLK